MKQFSSTYSNPKLFECEQIGAKQFSSTYSNPKLFECEHIATPTDYMWITPPENPTPRD